MKIRVSIKSDYICCKLGNLSRTTNEYAGKKQLALKNKICYFTDSIFLIFRYLIESYYQLNSRSINRIYR